MNMKKWMVSFLVSYMMMTLGAQTFESEGIK